MKRVLTSALLTFVLFTQPAFAQFSGGGFANVNIPTGGGYGYGAPSYGGGYGQYQGVGYYPAQQSCPYNQGVMPGAYNAKQDQLDADQIDAKIETIDDQMKKIKDDNLNGETGLEDALSKLVGHKFSHYIGDHIENDGDCTCLPPSDPVPAAPPEGTAKPRGPRNSSGTTVSLNEAPACFQFPTPDFKVQYPAAFLTVDNSWDTPSSQLLKSDLKIPSVAQHHASGTGGDRMPAAATESVQQRALEQREAAATAAANAAKIANKKAAVAVAAAAKNPDDKTLAAKAKTASAQAKAAQVKSDVAAKAVSTVSTAVKTAPVPPAPDAATPTTAKSVAKAASPAKLKAAGATKPKAPTVARTLRASTAKESLTADAKTDGSKNTPLAGSFPKPAPIAPQPVSRAQAAADQSATAAVPPQPEPAPVAAPAKPSAAADQSSSTAVSAGAWPPSSDSQSQAPSGGRRGQRRASASTSTSGDPQANCRSGQCDPQAQAPTPVTQPPVVAAPVPLGPPPATCSVVPQPGPVQPNGCPGYSYWSGPQGICKDHGRIDARVCSNEFLDQFAGSDGIHHLSSAEISDCKRDLKDLSDLAQRYARLEKEKKRLERLKFDLDTGGDTQTASHHGGGNGGSETTVGSSNHTSTLGLLLGAGLSLTGGALGYFGGRASAADACTMNAKLGYPCTGNNWGAVQAGISGLGVGVPVMQAALYSGAAAGGSGACGGSAIPYGIQPGYGQGGVPGVGGAFGYPQGYGPFSPFGQTSGAGFGGGALMPGMGPFSQGLSNPYGSPFGASPYGGFSGPFGGASGVSPFGNYAGNQYGLGGNLGFGSGAISPYGGGYGGAYGGNPYSQLAYRNQVENPAGYQANLQSALILAQQANIGVNQISQGYGGYGAGGYGLGTYNPTYGYGTGSYGYPSYGGSGINISAGFNFGGGYSSGYGGSPYYQPYALSSAPSFNYLSAGNASSVFGPSSTSTYGLSTTSSTSNPFGR